MTKRVERADKGVMALLRDVMKTHYPKLILLKASVAVLMVHPPVKKDGEPSGPALKCAGHAAIARIRVAGYSERILAKCDAIMEIDAHEWELLLKEQQVSLLDHELQHLVIARNAEGVTLWHPDERVKLKMQPDDIFFTGFEVIIERHGQHALEMRALATLAALPCCQGLFEFMDEPRAVEAVTV